MLPDCPHLRRRWRHCGLQASRCPPSLTEPTCGAKRSLAQAGVCRPVGNSHALPGPGRPGRTCSVPASPPTKFLWPGTLLLTPAPWRRPARPSTTLPMYVNRGPQPPARPCCRASTPAPGRCRTCIDVWLGRRAGHRHISSRLLQPQLQALVPTCIPAMATAAVHSRAFSFEAGRTTPRPCSPSATTTAWRSRPSPSRVSTR